MNQSICVIHILKMYEIILQHDAKSLINTNVIVLAVCTAPKTD